MKGCVCKLQDYTDSIMGERAIDPTVSHAIGMELVVPHASDPMWELQAYCGPDMDLAEVSMGKKQLSGEHLELVNANCAHCPVRRDCLADALEEELTQGIQKVIRGGYLPAHRKQFLETIRTRGGIRRYMWEALVEGRAPVRPQVEGPSVEQTPPELKLSA